MPVTNNDLDPARLEQMALHESGHAVAALVLGFTLHSLTIKGPESSHVGNMIIGIIGETVSSASDVLGQPDSPLRTRTDSAVVAMAGREGRRLKYPETDADWSGEEASDQHKARWLLDGFKASQDTDLTVVTAAAQRLVSEHQNAVKACATLLAQRVSKGLPAVIQGSEVAALLRDYPPVK